MLNSEETQTASHELDFFFQEVLSKKKYSNSEGKYIFPLPTDLFLKQEIPVAYDLFQQILIFSKYTIQVF